MACLWLNMKVVSGCTMLFGSRIINRSQEEAFSSLLSRLEEDKFSESDFFSFFFFLPATRVYFVITLARATKHQVGLALINSRRRGLHCHRNLNIYALGDYHSYMTKLLGM